MITLKRKKTPINVNFTLQGKKKQYERFYAAYFLEFKVQLLYILYVLEFLSNFLAFSSKQKLKPKTYKHTIHTNRQHKNNTSYKVLKNRSLTFKIYCHVLKLLDLL